MRRLLHVGSSLALMTVMLASCAESVHQRDRASPRRDSDSSSPQANWSSTVPIEAASVLPVGGAPSSYPQLKETLAAHEGQVVTLSGIVLKAKRLNGETEIEVLHLPMGIDGRPIEDRRQTQGRFLARQTTTFLDPAIVAARPVVTILGLVVGEVERPLEPGADNYSYPLLTIEQLTVWSPELLQSRVSSYAEPVRAMELSQATVASDFMVSLLGSILSSIVQAILNPDRHNRSSSSYSSSSNSNPSSPSQNNIPPQFKKRK
jgi:starvation-inducible outer membrane lipoprotein